MIKIQKNIKDNKYEIRRVEEEVNSLQQLDPSQRLDKIQRKMINEVCMEILTPLKMNISVDIKKLRKIVEDCVQTIEIHSHKH